MKLTHWKLGTVLLGVLILLCLVWWPEGEAPDSLQPVITTNDAAVSPCRDTRTGSGSIGGRS